MKISKIMTLLALSSAFCITSSSAALVSYAEENNYYVCFKSDNYSLLNKNKMDESGEIYVLKDVSLSSSNDFYVRDQYGSRYYNSNNKEMSVEDSSLLDYNIYYSQSYVFDEEHVTGSMYVSNSHITYEVVYKDDIKGDINGSEITLSYNPYQKKYDSFELNNVDISKDQVITLFDESGNTLSSLTCSSTNKYHIIYTPDKVIDGNTYRFNKDGQYGSGDDYVYNIYLEQVEEYYIYFRDITFSQYDATYDNKGLTLLERDLTSPNIYLYKSQDIYLSNVDQKVEYIIYHKEGNTFEEIDDDNDEDKISYKNGTYVGNYYLSLTVTNNTYVTSLSQDDHKYDDYYLAGINNSYLYTEDGKISLNDKFKFTLIDEDDSLYDKDYNQYYLKIYISKDEVGKEYYITNGKDYYKNGIKYIKFNQVGYYDVYFSNTHLYGVNQNYKYTLIDETKDLEYIKIETVDDFLKMISNCNENASYSFNKVFYLTSSIDLKGINVTSIKAFYGELNGNYHSINNLSLESDNDETNFNFIAYVGKKGSIKNLSIENLSIKAENSSNVGFIGKNLGSITDVKINGIVEGKNVVGGLVAYNSNYVLEEDDIVSDSSENYGYGTLIGIESNVKVKGENTIGGITGFNGGKIYESVSKGEVNNYSYSSKKTIERIGGIAGYSTGVIGLCSNEGNVGYYNEGNYVGGIAGLTTGMFFYNTNNALINGKNNVGGIAGLFGTLKNESSSDEDTNEETDLNKHYLTYCINKGEVKGSTNVGGIIGRVNATGIELENSISIGNITSHSGSYGGGIVGYLTSGSITSCISSGNLFTSGTAAGKYEGGIAGYSNGNITYCYATNNISGNDYLGGIVGYGSATSTLKSNVSSSLIAKLNSSTLRVGYIAGEIENILTDDVKNDNVKYNYYVDDNSDIGGINSRVLGSEFDDAASRKDNRELYSYEEINASLNKNFAGDGFIGGSKETSYPYLRNFTFFKENETYSLDYDQETLFNKYQENFLELEEEYDQSSLQFNFYEWDEDAGDIDELNSYKLIASKRYYGEQEIDYPSFVLAHLNSNNEYVYEATDGVYYAYFEHVEYTSSSTNIYAKYIKQVKTLKDGDYLIEGEFKEGTTAKVTQIGDTINVKLFYNEEEIDANNITLKIKTSENYNYEVSHNNEISSKNVTTFGEYKVIKLDSSKDVVILNEVHETPIPNYVIIILSVVGTIGVLWLTKLIVDGIKNKKKKTSNK